MLEFIVISDSESETAALSSSIRTRFIVECSRTDKAEHIHEWALGKTSMSIAERFSAYEALAEWIESILYDDHGNMLPVIACVDISGLELRTLNPITQHDAPSVIGMLILSYPEVQWVLLNSLLVPLSDHLQLSAELNTPIHGCACLSFSSPSLAEAVSLMHAGHAPQFDGDGLRDALYHVIRDSCPDDAPYLPHRERIAVAIDDECSYAHFNAYTAFRFGYRSYAVSSMALMAQLVGKDHGTVTSPDVVFEDRCLNFPDRDASEHLLDFAVRDGKFKHLKNAGFRAILTACPDKTLARYFRSIGFISTRRNKYRPSSGQHYWAQVPKPFSGTFGLISSIDLASAGRRKKEPCRCIAAKQRHSISKSGHSCPGALLAVANRLMRRANRMLGTITDVEGAVHVAVLSVTASELLGGRTPTTAMDALKLKHMAEVSAECQFSGVEYHIEIKPRLKEIRKDSIFLSRWFQRRRKAMSAMNAEMTTVIELMRIFRDHGQFDESLICQNRVRHLHNRLWICQKPFPRLFCFPFLKYLEVILASFRWFLVAIAGWMVLAASLFAGVEKVVRTSSGSSGVVGHWEQAFTTFTGANGFTSGNFLWNLLTVCAVLCGIAHIGIFISHVYMLVSRKD